MTGGAALSVSLLTNAYDAERKPFQRWEKDGLLRYFDRQKATPVTGSFQPQLAGLPGQQGRNNYLTEKNLADARLPKKLNGIGLGGQSLDSLSVAEYLEALSGGSSRPESPSGNSPDAQPDDTQPGADGQPGAAASRPITADLLREIQTP